MRFYKANCNSAGMLQYSWAARESFQWKTGGRRLQDGKQVVKTLRKTWCYTIDDATPKQMTESDRQQRGTEVTSRQF